MTTSRHLRIAALRSDIGHLWLLAWPILIGQLATFGMTMSDVAMSGHLSAGDLAAVALGAALWTVVYVTLTGLMMPTNALVAHEFGAGQFDRIAPLVRQALWMAVGIGMIAILVINAATGVFDYLGLDPVVHAKALGFVHCISLGFPALTLYRTLYGYSASINQPKPMMLISLGGLAFNILLNWLLVFGNWGLPQLGATGCAIVTAAGLWLMFGVMVWWIRRAPEYRATDPFGRWDGPDRRQIAAMLRLGVPMGVTSFAEVSAFSSICLLVARYGTVATAANQVTLNFVSLIFVIPMSFGISMITRIGQALGEGAPVKARSVAWMGVGLSMAFAILSTIVIALGRHGIAAAYVADPQVREMVAGLLVFAAIFQLADAAQVSASCAIRGYKVTRRPMLIHLMSFWGICVPVGCVLALGLVPAWLPWHPAAMATEGFWIGLTIGLTVAALLLLNLLHRVSRERIIAAQRPALSH